MFACFGSAEEVDTFATLTYVDSAIGCATSVIVALAPLARLPRLASTGPVPLHDPWLEVAETKFRPAGSESVTWTPSAVAGPLFVTVRW